MSHEPDRSGWIERAEKPSGLDSAVAAGLPLTAPERPKPRLKPINRQQLLLRTVEVEQLVPEDHEVRAIWELVGQLDLSPYYRQIRAVEGVAGREPVDPQLLISLWIYAYSEGVSSAREVSRLCEYHPAYQWLTGMEVINHHTLSDFRVDHREALDELFAKALGLLSAEGLISLERVMQDGTKVKACAGADTFRREGRLESHLEMARQQVAAMEDPRSAEEVSPRVRAARRRAAREKQQRLELALQELEKIRASKSGAEAKAEARASQSDPEARVMKQSDGGWAPSYNVQLSTDATAGIIVGVGVSQSGSDYEQLIPAVERVEDRFGQRPAQVVADGGFTSRPNIMDLDQRGVDFIGSMGDGAAQSAGQMDRRGVDPAFRPEAFTYDAATDTYTCPGGQTLKYQSKEERPGRTNYQYRAKATDCQACPLKAKCCPQNASKGRMIVRGMDHPVVAAFNEKMQTEAAQQIYKQRGAVAEFPHAWIKDKLGLRQFRLRGLIKVGMEALWACLTYNIQQWIRLRWRLRWAENRA
jgi:transposase